MSKVYDAMMRAQRERGDSDEERTLRDRLRRWIPRRRSEAPTQRTALPEPPAAPVPLDPGPAPEDELATVLRERLASLEVAVDALDDRLSAEVVEREAKLLEELRRGMRGLENELSERFSATTLEIGRQVRLGTGLVVGFVALLSGLVVGVLAVI